MLAGAFSSRSKNKKVKEFDSKHDRSDCSSGSKAAVNNTTANIQRQISTLSINTKGVNGADKTLDISPQARSRKGSPDDIDLNKYNSVFRFKSSMVEHEEGEDQQ